MKNIEDLKRKSLEQFSELRKKALHESYRNAPVQIVQAAAAGGGSVPTTEEPGIPTEPDIPTGIEPKDLEQFNTDIDIEAFKTDLNVIFPNKEIKYCKRKCGKE